MPFHSNAPVQFLVGPSQCFDLQPRVIKWQCLPVFSFSAVGSSPTDTRKSASELQHEQEILSEIMRTVEKRDQLVSVLEEQRLKERAEDKDLEGLLLSKGYEFHWAPADDGYWPEKLE